MASSSSRKSSRKPPAGAEKGIDDTPAVEPSDMDALDSGPRAGLEEALLEGEKGIDEAGEMMADGRPGASIIAEADEEAVAPLPEEAVAMPEPGTAKDLPGIYTDDLTPQGPGSEAAKQEKVLDADPKMVELLMTDNEILGLWARIGQVVDKTYQRVQSLTIARQVFSQVRGSRNELMAGADHYEEAEQLINEAKYRVEQSERVRVWSYTFGAIIFLYEFGMSIFLAYALITYLLPGLSPGSPTLVYMLTSVLFGSLGGVMGAWYSLVKHVAQDQDFEWQHTMWYLTSPLLGALTGLVVFIIAMAGLKSMIAVPVEVANNPNALIATPWAIYILAFLTGYQHNIFISLLKRVLKVFEDQMAEAEKKKEEEPAGEEEKK